MWRGLLKCLGLGKGKLGRSKTRPISNDASNEGSFVLRLTGKGKKIIKGKIHRLKDNLKGILGGKGESSSRSQRWIQKRRGPMCKGGCRLNHSCPPLALEVDQSIDR